MSRTYTVFSTTETGSIDFSQVYETSNETLRLSVDGTKTFVKYDTNTYTDESGSLITVIPSSVENLTTTSGSYTHSEILALLATDEWTNPNGVDGE